MKTFRRALIPLAILLAIALIPAIASAASQDYPSVAAFRAAHPKYCAYDAATNTTTLTKSVTLKRYRQLTVLKGETLVIPQSVRLNSGKDLWDYNQHINTQGILRYYTSTANFLVVGEGLTYVTDEVFPNRSYTSISGGGTAILTSPQACGTFRAWCHVILTGAANLDQCANIDVGYECVLDLTETTAQKHTLRNLDCLGGKLLLGGHDLEVPLTRTLMAEASLIGGGTLTVSGAGIMEYYDSFLGFDGPVIIDGGALHLVSDDKITIDRALTNRGILLAGGGAVHFKTAPDNASGLILATGKGSVTGLNAITFDGADGQTISARLGGRATSAQFYESDGPVNLKKYLGVFSRPGYVQTGWLADGTTVATDATVTLTDGATVAAIWTQSGTAPKNQFSRKKPLMIKGDADIFTSVRSLRYNAKGELEIQMFVYNRTKKTFSPRKLSYMQLEVYYGNREIDRYTLNGSLKTSLRPGHTKTYKATLKSSGINPQLNLTSPDLHFVLWGKLTPYDVFVPLCVTADGVVPADWFVIDEDDF